MEVYNYKSLDAQCHGLGMVLLYVCIYATWIRHIMRDRERKRNRQIAFGRGCQKTLRMEDTNRVQTTEGRGAGVEEEDGDITVVSNGLYVLR